MAGDQGENDKSSLRFSGLIQFEKVVVQAKTALGTAVTALNGVTLTGILIHSASDFNIGLRCLPAA